MAARNPPEKVKVVTPKRLVGYTQYLVENSCYLATITILH